jgi:4-amino-4-deoxy-L-arabinose transferase-like glycosyltransferase
VAPCVTVSPVSEIQPQAAERAGRRPHTSSSLRWDVVLLAGLLTLGVAIPFVVGLAAGSQNIPRSDDWVYRRIALDLSSTGVLSLHSVTTMMVGQIVLAQPFITVFGPRSWAFSAFGIVAAIGAVLASYVLARQFISPVRAALAASLLLIFPGFLAYATSFMTDVPTLALELACLVLGVIALRDRPVRTRWLLASAVVGCLAFSIREFAIAAPASALFAAICAEPRRRRFWALAIGVALGCGLLYLLKLTLPGQQVGATVGSVGTGGITVTQLIQSVPSVSLPLLPAAILAGLWWRGQWKRSDIAIGAELGLLVVGYQLFQWYHDGTIPLVLLVDLANQRGVPGTALPNYPLFGTRPLLFGDAAWLVVLGVALVASIVVMMVAAGIAGACARRYGRSLRAIRNALGSPIGLLVLFSGGTAVGLTLYGFHWPIFDRYYWVLIPPAATILLYLPRSSVWRRAAPAHPGRAIVAAPIAAALVGVTFVSVTFMLNSFAFDSARWRAGETLTQLGVRPDEVDAGYEWVGSHAPVLPDSVQPGSGLTIYETYFPGYRACGLVSSDAVGPPGYEPVASEGYSLDLIGGPTEYLYLYRGTSPDCQPR